MDNEKTEKKKGNSLFAICDAGIYGRFFSTKIKGNVTLEAAVIIPAFLGLVTLFLFGVLQIHDAIVLYSIGAEERYESYLVFRKDPVRPVEKKVFLWGESFQIEEKGNSKNYIKPLDLPDLGVFKGMTKGYNWTVTSTQISRKLYPTRFIRNCIRARKSLETISSFDLWTGEGNE